MIIKHKPIEKKPVPQMRDLIRGEVFQLVETPNRIFILTEFEGDDFEAMLRYRYGDDDDKKINDFIDNEFENEGKDKCTGSYCVAINLGTGEFALFHESVKVIPLNCELYFQEKENYNI